ncbi:MAG: hypothetical protein ING36_10775 [Burkholderiales bacterium]|jgi:hypothetical protein|nr:hypothetical protein [Burkholderiales bacterium]
MKLVEFKPENDFERAVLNAKNGDCSMDDLIKIVSESVLYVPSQTEVMQDGRGFQPLLLDAGGNPLVAACSSFGRVDLHRQVAEYVIQMNGKDFLLRLPTGYGVVLNPGYVAQLIVLPDAVAGIKASLR